MGLHKSPRRRVYIIDKRRFWTLGFEISSQNQAGFTPASRAILRCRCRIAVARIALGVSLTLSANAAAARKQTKPQSTSYHTSSATQPPKSRARGAASVPTACSKLKKIARVATNRRRTAGDLQQPCLEKEGPSEQKSKKAIAEAKRIRADQTFGIKNKGKSAKAKQYVSRVEHSLTGNEKKAQQERKEKLKAKREQREAEGAEERALFSETTDVMKVKKKGQASSVQKADEDLSEEMEKALLRAKELFDAGAMSMQDYQNYREQILAPDSDEEDEDGGDEATASEAESGSPTCV